MIRTSLVNRSNKYARMAVVLFLAFAFATVGPMRRSASADPSGSDPAMKNIGTRETGPIGKAPLVGSSAFLGPISPDEPLTLSIAFRLDDKAGLAQLEEDLYDPQSPIFHQWLTPEEFGKRFGRSSKEIQAATGWLTRQGLQVEQVWPNNLAITFSGPAGAVEAAFNVSISEYRDETKNRVFYSNDRPPTLPVDLRGFTENIFGLDNAHLYHSDTKSGPPLTPTQIEQFTKRGRPRASYPDGTLTDGTPFISPSDLQTAYDITPLSTVGIQGQGQRVAIISDSDANDSDIEAFRVMFHLPPAVARYRCEVAGSQRSPSKVVRGGSLRR